jgi:four helix bundle protein
MGANDQEADGASTTNDFIHCYTVVRKEGKESVFWLRVIGRTNSAFENEANKLVQEGSEIVAIVSTILSKTHTNRRKK